MFDDHSTTGFEGFYTKLWRGDLTMLQGTQAPA